MRRKTSALAAAVLGLAALAGGGLAQEPAAPEGQGERVGEKVGRAVDRTARGIGRGVEDVTAAVRKRFERARGEVEQMGTEGRIYGRLHWDKALHDARIELEVREGGVAVLRGQVADATAKGKAVTLTSDTLGVTRVVDELTIRPRTTEETPAADPGRPPGE